MTDERGPARVQRYLEMSANARAAARRCGDPELVDGYLELAAIWLQLAENARASLPPIDFRRAEAQDAPAQRNR